jgi:hypothetical protein
VPTLALGFREGVRVSSCYCRAVPGYAGERRRGRWLGGLALATGGLLSARPLHAEPVAERTFSLAYAVPEGCPARGTFVAAILARAPEAGEAEGTAALAFDVKLEPEGELTRGTFTVRFVHGEHFEREVPPARCSEVTQSMAIMAGLLLSGALLPEPAPPPDAEKPIETPPPAPPPAPIAPAVPLAPSRFDEARTPPAVPESAPADPGQLRPAAFLHGGVGLGALPVPSAGLSAGAELGLARRSVWSPSLRAGYLLERASAARSPLGRAVFALDAGLVQVCPWRLALSERSALALCAHGAWGSLRVTARSTDHPLERTMPWVALGGAARVEAALGDHFALEAAVTAFGLAHHDRFLFQPGNVLLHEVPAASGSLSFGLLYRPL